MIITRGQLRRIVKEEAQRLRESGVSVPEAPDQGLVIRLLNEAITLVERASQLASRGALEAPYAAELERIDEELRSFVLDLGGGDDTAE
jgi:hypothetical protein